MDEKLKDTMEQTGHKDIYYDENIKDILKPIEGFMDGYRVVMLHHRAKEGGHNRPDYKAVKRVSASKEEFFEVFKDLHKLKEKEPSIPYRIYSSVNARDIEKAIRNFKFEQLETDYLDDRQRHQWYKDIKNRFIGALMSPRSRAETQFLVDVDEGDKVSFAEALDVLEEHTEVITSYATPNGYHAITKPFNPNLTPDLEIKKDAMLYICS